MVLCGETSSYYSVEKHQVTIQHKRAQCYGGGTQICTSSNSDVALAIKVCEMVCSGSPIWGIKGVVEWNICDRISHNKASTHTKSNLRFYQKWIAGHMNTL